MCNAMNPFATCVGQKYVSVLICNSISTIKKGYDEKDTAFRLREISVRYAYNQQKKLLFSLFSVTQARFLFWSFQGCLFYPQGRLALYSRLLIIFLFLLQYHVIGV